MARVAFWATAVMVKSYVPAAVPTRVVVVVFLPQAEAERRIRNAEAVARYSARRRELDVRGHRETSCPTARMTKRARRRSERRAKLKSAGLIGVRGAVGGVSEVIRVVVWKTTLNFCGAVGVTSTELGVMVQVT